MLINDVMTRGAVTCRPDDTLEHVVKLMWDFDIGFVPVVDDTSRLVGVITDRDILMTIWSRGAALRTTSVEAAMIHPPTTCTIRDQAAQVEQRMAQHQLRRLPVVDHDAKIVGVVTLADIARASMRSHDLSSRGPTSTLAAITHPRHPTRAAR